MDEHVNPIYELIKLPRNQADYLLGFFGCDGSLEGNRCTMSLQIQERDRVVLNLFKRGLEAKEDVIPRVIKGKRYIRARRHSQTLWMSLRKFYGGSEKRVKRFPLFASDEFVLGCLDADGCFYTKNNGVEGEFCHPSPHFIKGLSAWFDMRGYPPWQRKRLSYFTLYFAPRTCRFIGELYSKTLWGLRRKADVITAWPEPSKCWWRPDELELLRDYQTLGSLEISKRLARTPKAVQLKALRLGYAKSRS